MDLIRNGKILAERRVAMGLTQKQLADKLFVTDKAVSKWERGLSMPDSSLLTKLSSILDLDVEILIHQTSSQFKWTGRLILNDNRLYKEKIGNFSLLFQMLAYFALVEIRDIEIITNDAKYINNLNLSKYGFNIFVNSSLKSEHVFEINDSFFLFGANLTRHLKYMMSCDCNIQPTYFDYEMPIKFIVGSENISYKTFGRGYVFIPIKNVEDLKNANIFVNIVQKFSHFNIGDIEEISALRNSSKLQVDKK